MTRTGLFSLLTATLLVACGEPPADDVAGDPAAETAGGDATAMAADEEAIAALGDYWETHYNMQHADMVASVYTDDAWVAPAAGGMFEGREAIQGWLAASMESAPTIEIMPADTWVKDGWAVGMGMYALTTTDEGAASGAYMNALQKVDGEWKIAGTMSNFGASPPEDTEWGPSMTDAPPPDAPRFPELVQAYEAAFNAGDAAGIAALYTDDAQVALSDGPILIGRSAVQEAMAARMTPGATLEIHEVGGQDFGDGWSGAGGWYQINGPDGAAVQSGFWMNVVQVQADGTPRIVKSLTNARPGSM